MSEEKKDNTNKKKGVSFEALSSLDAPVSFWKGIPFGLQHVMAMFVANLAPIFLVASAANMSAEQSATIIQAGLLVAGLGTCLQLYGVWLIGSRTANGHGHFLHICGRRPCRSPRIKAMARLPARSCLAVCWR